MNEKKNKPKDKSKTVFIVAISILVIIAIILALLLLIFATPLKDILFMKRVAQEEPTEEQTITEEPTEETTEELTTTEETTEETTQETTEETTEVTEETTEALSAPTINLEIYMGPTYSSADNVCFYRVKANTTGNPTPTIEFNKDDSLGAWGSNKAQVNLNSPSDTFELEATATNSEGTATDSITLSWGCETENQDPVISEITLMGTKYTNTKYKISVAASDPDGDSLIYKWVVTNPRGDPNGTIDNDTANPIKWTTPSTPGEYRIAVFVEDGKGGEASAHEIVDVHFLYDLLAKAPDAYWYSGDGGPLWDVGLSDNRGFACFRTNIKLEDGNTYPKVLETHPQWINDGRISSEYPDLSITIPDGARFTAKVGFIKGATATDGVNFRMQFYDGSRWYFFPSYSGYHATYNGALDSLNIDLSSIVGKTGRICIGVKAESSSDQDWAVWVNPQITN